MRDGELSQPAALATEPPRGRPRDPRTNGAILSATRRLLARDGYDQVSIVAIARAAKVSRPTVYRRWPAPGSSRRTCSAFSALVRSGVDQSTVDADLDVEMAYDTLVGTCFYIAHVLQPDRTADGADGVVTRLCTLLLQGAAVPKIPKKGQR